MKSVTLYSADWCPYCQRAKKLLDTQGIPYKEINVDREPGLRAKIMNETGMKTIPQIFIGEYFVGGYTDLAELDKSGQLKGLLSE